MEKCKFCGAELEEDVTLCPACNKDNAAETASEAAEVTPEETVPAEQTAEEVSEETVEEASAEPAEEAEEEPSEKTPEESKKATPGKIALAVVAIIVLVALIIAMLVGGMGGGNMQATVPNETVDTTPAETEPTVPPTVPADTGLDDVTHKGSYSATDEEAIAAADTVVATMGDKTLTNAELQVYYWSYAGSYVSSEYGYQAMMYGMIDLARPLDTQLSLADQSLTWQQYFLKSALQNWQSLQAMALEAEEAGYTITEESEAILEGVPADLEAMAEQYGAESVDQLIADNFGAGATSEEFIKYQRIYYEGAPYYNDEMAKIAFTDAEIEAFFNEHEEEYAQQGLTRDETVVDVRHVLIMPEGATSETIRTETFSDEAWAAAEKEANDLLVNWKKGDKTEESFAQMADENTDDGNDANMDGQPDGGLYTGVTKGQMVAEFEDWCFDSSRQAGDVGIVKTMYGYHIMYFIKGEAVWPHYAEQDLMAKTENEFLMSIIEKHPIEVDYSAIQLAAIPMA